MFTLHHLVTAVSRGGLRRWHHPKFHWHELYRHPRTGRVYRLVIRHTHDRRWLALNPYPIQPQLLERN